MAFDRADAPGRDPDAPQFDPNEHLGDLLVLQVSGVQEGVQTEYGERDVIVADVFVIKPDATISAAYEEAWLFGTVLHNQLKKKKGRTVLGVLELGEKKPGKKPPWRLADPNDQQEAVAIRAMATRPDSAEPEQQQPARQQNGWGSSTGAAPAAAQDPWSTPAPAGAPATAAKAPWE